jgi:hypothetical protein
MKKLKIFGALLEGALYATFMWVGDRYLLDNDNAFYVYIIEALVFAVAVYLYDKFFNK